MKTCAPCLISICKHWQNRRQISSSHVHIGGGARPEQMYKSSKSKVNRHKEQRGTTKASNGRQAVRHFPLDPVAPSIAKEGMTVCILFAYIVTLFPSTPICVAYPRRYRSS